MSLYAQIQKNIVQYFHILKEQSSAKYAKETIIGLGIAVCLTAGYFLHSFYVQKREQQAFGALIEVIESFEKTQYDQLQSEQKQNDEQVDNAWQDTEFLIDALYKQNSSSYLAPYFLIFKSLVMVERKQSGEDARKMLESALLQIPRSSAMFELFNLKRILMAFDAQDEQVRTSALQDLIQVTKDEKSNVFEQASYMLGLYYLSSGSIDQARMAFAQVAQTSDKTALIRSAWAKQAEEKLESMQV